MPKSKRQRTKALTQTNSKGVELKQKLVEKIREAIDKFDSLYVFSFENMRTNHFKEVRLAFRDSRFFLGKNKVMKVALGCTTEEEYADGLAKVADELSGSVGLLFTSKDRKEVEEYFHKFSVVDYARSGFKATENVSIPEGPLTNFVGSMVEGLRKLGLPVELQNGVIHVLHNYTICKEGDVLTPEQAKLLEHFGRQMAKFALTLECRWSNGICERYGNKEKKTKCKNE